MSRSRMVWVVTLAGASLVWSGLRAQAPPAQPALNVFLDCQTFFCDFDHIRREIAFVNWVRDRQDAQVHILGTGQHTGGGGQEYTFTFIGLKDFAGHADTLRLVTRNTDTAAEIRDAQVQILKLGLMRYVAATPVRDRLRISYTPEAGPAGQPAASGAARDPWKLWVFSANLNANLQGEQQQNFQFLFGSLSANRTADDLKLNFRISGSYQRSEQQLTSGSFINTSKSYSASQSAVFSLGPKWSFGVRSAQNSSTFLNQALAIRVGPALEYDVFPYSESTRRQLTVRYSPEVSRFDYEEATIFDKTSETLSGQRLNVSLRVLQPWGQIQASLDALQYFHDLSKHRVSLFGAVELRLVRGLNFNIGGDVARTKDQLYLPKAGLTDEEILVRRRQLGTSFQYFTFIGLSFRFGSKFANVVNSRMPGLDGDGGFSFSFSF